MPPSEMVAVLEWWSGTECTLHTDPESFQLYCGWTFCERFGVLGVREQLS